MTPPLNTPMFDSAGTITIQWKNWFLGEASADDSSALFSDPRPTQLSQLDFDLLAIALNALTLNGTRPTLLFDSGSTARARIEQSTAAARLDITINAYYDGTNWQRDNTAAASALLTLTAAGLEVSYTASGAGAVTWSSKVKIDLVNGRLGIGTATPAKPLDVVGDITSSGDVLAVNVDLSGVYKVAGVQVVGAKQPDPGTSASSPSVSTSNTSRTAGTTYTAANEQQMLNELKTAVSAANTAIANLAAQLNNLITDRNNLRAVLQAHGLQA